MEWKRRNGKLTIDNNIILYCCEGKFSMATYCYICKKWIRGDHYRVVLDYNTEMICSNCYIKRSLLTI